MTAIRDRRSDPDAANEDAHIPWDERAALGARRGLPWWGAVLLAFGTAVVGAVLDTQINDGLSVLFHVIYLIGAVTAVGAVRRRNLFGPMVQPPLILAVTVPAVVLTGSGLPESSDTLAKLLAIGTPLINGFPMMAVTTALTVGLGLYRMYRERDPEASAKPRAKGARAEGTPKKRPDDARGAAKSAAGEAKRKPRPNPSRPRAVTRVALRAGENHRDAAVRARRVPQWRAPAQQADVGARRMHRRHGVPGPRTAIPARPAARRLVNGPDARHVRRGCRRTPPNADDASRSGRIRFRVLSDRAVRAARNRHLAVEEPTRAVPSGRRAGAGRGRTTADGSPPRLPWPV
ncbi:DUF6542 domain-containing protein [Prauserella oleivorans]